MEGDVPELTQDLNNKSLTEGRDVLKAASEAERKKWLAKTGDDWSGAFGDDPRAYTNKNLQKIAEPGKDAPPHDPVQPSDDDDDDEGPDTSDSDLGVTDATNITQGGFDKKRTNGRRSFGGESANGGPRSSMDTTRTSDTGYTTMTQGSASPVSKRDAKWEEKAEKRTETRKHRGLSQWTPARSVKFARDEGKFGMAKLKKRFTGGLGGREPGVETEA